MHFTEGNVARAFSVLIISFAMLALCAAPGRADTQNPPYTVIDLGPVQSTGDSGKDINAANIAVFTRSTEIYRYENGQILPYGNLFANNGPLDINDVGHLAYSRNLESYIYRNGVSTNLGSLEGHFTFTADINNSDTVVGYSYRSSANRYRAYIWTNGVMSQLPAPGGTYLVDQESRAHAINHNGDIAGSFNTQGPGAVAVTWTNGVATALSTLPGYTRSEAYGINLAGQAVGYSANDSISVAEPVLWNGTTPTSLGWLPGLTYAIAEGINDNGDVVGWAKYGPGDPGGSAFIYTQGILRDLNVLIPAGSGWHLTAAYAINNSDWIVGYGTLNGSQRSFLLVPEPAGLGLVAVSAVFLFRRRWER